MMMTCLNCGSCFLAEDLTHWTDWVADVFGGHSEVWECCPNCGSSDVDEISACDMCGEKWPERKINNDGMCPDCVRGLLIYGR